MRSKCLCFSRKILIFPCSGASIHGELSDRVARNLSLKTKITMCCLAGALANDIKFQEVSRKADFVISLDGCPMACATRALSAAGVKGIVALSMTNLCRGRTIAKADKKTVAALTREIIRLLEIRRKAKHSLAVPRRRPPTHDTTSTDRNPGTMKKTIPGNPRE